MAVSTNQAFNVDPSEANSLYSRRFNAGSTSITILPESPFAMQMLHHVMLPISHNMLGSASVLMASCERTNLLAFFQTFPIACLTSDMRYSPACAAYSSAYSATPTAVRLTLRVTGGVGTALGCHTFPTIPDGSDTPGTAKMRDSAPCGRSFIAFSGSRARAALILRVVVGVGRGRGRSMG